MEPSIGRFVHYIMPIGRNPGACRPGIIVNIFDQKSNRLQLQVFTDGSNDGAEYAEGCVWVPSVALDALGKEAGSWHDPMICPAFARVAETVG